MAGTPISSQGGRDCLTKLLPIRSVDFLIGQISSNKVLRWALFTKQNLKIFDTFRQNSVKISLPEKQRDEQE
jgi:hypothetical protein